MASKYMNLVGKIYNKHRNEGAIGRSYLLNRKKILEIYENKEKEILQGIEHFLLNLYQSMHYSIFFDTKSMQDLKYISSRLSKSLNPESELKTREEIRLIHKKLNISYADFCEFVNGLVNDIRTIAQLHDWQVDVISDRLKSFEKEIVKE